MQICSCHFIKPSVSDYRGLFIIATNIKEKTMKASKNTTARIRLARHILQVIKDDIARGYKPCKSEVKELKELLSSARIGLRQDKFNNYYKQLKSKEL